MSTENSIETDWEAHYQQGDTHWDKGEASPGLADFLEKHQTGLKQAEVLVPGCGTGHDVRAWTKAGFQTVGYDLAPSAIRLCEEKTKAAGLSASFHQGNFLKDSPLRQFDWVFEHTLYCAIHPSQRQDYAQAVSRWLKPDGQFLAVHYFIPDEDGPPFGTTREEVVQRFSPFFELVEDWVPRSYPNRTNLERMFWWRHKTAS